jgi:CRISPR-associated endonuclease/helicase Cas3
MHAAPVEFLAHSAAANGGTGDPYARHIERVRAGTLERAKTMLTYSIGQPAELLDAIDAAAAFHDLGKLDPQNQAALRSGRQARLPWDHVDAGVAHLSQSGSWMAAWLIRAHHAPGLPCMARHFDPDGLGRQLRGCRHDDDIDEEKHQSQIARTDERLRQYLEAHEAVVGSLDPVTMKPRHGLTMRLALSCLVDADHADTAWFDTGFVPPEPLPTQWQERLEQLDAYVASLPSSGDPNRDRHRSEFYATCREAATDVPMIACEAPVGLGKTTAITAHLLQRAIQYNLRHLIIIAPFTNIISQTVRVLRKALTLPDEAPEDVVVEHHHRADFSGRADRELAVLWRAPVIVTTAVQLFETLASNHPGQLRKLHELPGSSVFIDEAHAALPASLWPQNWRWLRELVEAWGCHVIFASGSLARFWENDEIIDRPVKLPELLAPNLAHEVFRAERKRIHYESCDRLIESVAELTELVTRSQGPRLVILNTVQSAAVVARALREDGCDVVHLSTALCPRDRDIIVRKIVDRLAQRHTPDWTLVATSCVEAGVDFSFRTAFRERFSTASLIQVGGRVNRHSEFDGIGGGIVFDFVIDAIGGITAHPSARESRAVLRNLFRRGIFDRMDIQPAQLVSDAMAEEIRNRGGLGRDALGEAEREHDYPKVADQGKVICAETCLVVVDPFLQERIEQHIPVSFRTLLEGSVQIWTSRIRSLHLNTLTGRREIYAWPYEYDPQMLGYMAGVLKIHQFVEEGGAIL